MLVLSRKSDQTVVIGGSDHFEYILKVTVLEIGRGRVSLGFEARRDVPVHRAEVWERMHAGRLRDRSTGGSDRTGSRNADKKACVLSGG